MDQTQQFCMDFIFVKSYWVAYHLERDSEGPCLQLSGCHISYCPGRRNCEALKYLPKEGWNMDYNAKFSCICNLLLRHKTLKMYFFHNEPCWNNVGTTHVTCAVVFLSQKHTSYIYITSVVIQSIRSQFKNKDIRQTLQGIAIWN